jgi:hypothetical protein
MDGCLAAEANLDAAGRCALASVLVCQHGVSEIPRNSQNFNTTTATEDFEASETACPQRGERAFRSAVPCAWSPRVPQALAINCQRFRSCEGSSTVRKPWPEEHKRPSQGYPRYELVETAVTVGALFGAAPHPCATNLQRNDAVQGAGEGLRGAGDACGCRPVHSLLVNGASCVCTSQGTLCSLGYRWYGANRRARRARRTAATGL